MVETLRTRHNSTLSPNPHNDPFSAASRLFPRASSGEFLCRNRCFSARSTLVTCALYWTFCPENPELFGLLKYAEVPQFSGIRVKVFSRGSHAFWERGSFGVFRRFVSPLGAYQPYSHYRNGFWRKWRGFRAIATQLAVFLTCPVGEIAVTLAEFS